MTGDGRPAIIQRMGREHGEWSLEPLRPTCCPSDMAGSASGGGRGPRRVSIWLKEHRGAGTAGRCCIREARRVKGRGRSGSRDATPNAQQCTPTARHVRPLLTAGDKRARPPPGRSKTRRDWLCRAARWIVGFPPRAEPHPGQTPSMSRLRGGSGPGSSATGSPWERAEHPARLAGCKPGSLSCCCRRRGSFSIRGDSRVPLKLFAPVPGCPSAGPADRSRSARGSLPAPHDAAAGQ